MTSSSEAFIQAYNRVAVPHPIATQHAEDPEFTIQKDSYFTRLQYALDLSHLVLSETVTIKANAFVTDDQPRSLMVIEDLCFNDMQVMASAIRCIGPGAAGQARFAKYDLTPETIDVIQDFRIIEGTIF